MSVLCEGQNTNTVFLPPEQIQPLVRWWSAVLDEGCQLQKLPWAWVPQFDSCQPRHREWLVQVTGEVYLLGTCLPVTLWPLMQSLKTLEGSLTGTFWVLHCIFGW